MAPIRRIRCTCPDSLARVQVWSLVRDLFDQELARIGADPNIVVETDQREALVPLVLAGAGTTLLPAGLAHEASARGAVVALRPACPDESVSYTAPVA